MTTNIINRSTAPETGALHFEGFPAYKQELINNQFPCYSVENFSSNVVRLDISIPSGSWMQSKPLQSSSMARMITEGTKQFNSFQIAEAIDFSGAYLDVSSSPHRTILSIYAVKDILVSLLPLVKSILTEPTFPADELKTILANNKQEFIISNKKVMGRARRFFPSLLYGNRHPYGTVIEEKHFDALSTEDMQSLFNALPLCESSIFLGGNIDEDVMEHLQNLFSDAAFAKSTSTSEQNYNCEPSSEKEHLITVSDAVQSALVLGTPVVGRSHPDFPVLMLTNTILGGFFGSRLMKTIREEKGYTYGISSGITARTQASHFSIQTEVMAEVTQQALDEIFSEISRLSVAPVEMNELDIARNYLFGSFLRNMDGPFALVERLQTALQENLDPNVYYRSYWDAIAAATPADIQHMAQKYLIPENMHVLIVGNKQ